MVDFELMKKHYNLVPVQQVRRLHPEVPWEGKLNGYVWLKESGDVYDGEWKMYPRRSISNGKFLFHGHGIYYNASDERYFIGEMCNSECHGHGKCFWLSTSKVWRNNFNPSPDAPFNGLPFHYDGHYVHELRDGPATCIFKDGQSVPTTWRQGSIVNPPEISPSYSIATVRRSTTIATSTSTVAAPHSTSIVASTSSVAAPHSTSIATSTSSVAAPRSTTIAASTSSVAAPHSTSIATSTSSATANRSTTIAASTSSVAAPCSTTVNPPLVTTSAMTTRRKASENASTPTPPAVIIKTEPTSTVNSNQNKRARTEEPATLTNSGIKEKLRELKELFDEGLLAETVFIEAQRKVIEKL